MPHLRPAARAIILDPDDRVLLCRFDFTDRGGPVVWAAPGGGVEPGESLLDALRRELTEEVGLELIGTPPHVWHQEVVAAGHAAGYDGVINDHFLVRAAAFYPRGALSDAELAAENVSAIRWWAWDELMSYAGTDLFSPRALPAHLAKLLSDGVPDLPVRIGQ
jgi:ADP-ribose pyrophosphatase YjhB (NUDIX family)